MTQSSAIATVREEMNRLRGRLFGAAEATGMPEKQETAFKNIVRQATYEIQTNLEAKLRRNGDMTDAND